MERNIQDLIDYLENIKKIVGNNAKVLIDSEIVDDFESSIAIDKINKKIDFVSNGYTY